VKCSQESTFVHAQTAKNRRFVIVTSFQLPIVSVLIKTVLLTIFIWEVKIIFPFQNCDVFCAIHLLIYFLTSRVNCSQTLIEFMLTFIFAGI